MGSCIAALISTLPAACVSTAAVSSCKWQKRIEDIADDNGIEDDSNNVNDNRKEDSESPMKRKNNRYNVGCYFAALIFILPSAPVSTAAAPSRKWQKKTEGNADDNDNESDNNNVNDNKMEESECHDE